MKKGVNQMGYTPKKLRYPRGHKVLHPGIPHQGEREVEALSVKKGKYQKNTARGFTVGA